MGKRTGFGAAADTRALRFGVFIENATDAGRQRTMLGASRAHADELSFDQLVFPVVIRKIEQLVCGHECAPL